MANSEYNLTVVDGTALTISLSGPVGPAGTGGGGGTPAGGAGSVQFSNGTALAADSGLVYTGTGNAGKLTVGGGRIFMDATTGDAPSNNIAIGGSNDKLPFSVVGFSGYLNVSVGAGNFQLITTGQRNVACGAYTLTNVTSGSQNVAIGNNTLYDLVSGNRNTAIGNAAGLNQTTGSDNIFINRAVESEFGNLNSQILIGGKSDGAQSTVIGFEGDNNISPTLTTRFIGSTLTFGTGVANVNSRTSLVQTASTSAKTIYLPDANGTLPVVPAYADLNAANAALNAGDFWWDTTLKQLRTAIS